jgi:hypothetical protein
MAMVVAKFQGGLEPLLIGSLVMTRYESAQEGLADFWEERLITGVCADKRCFTAVDIHDQHYVHAVDAIIEAVKVGPRGGLHVEARRSKLAFSRMTYEYAEEDVTEAKNRSEDVAQAAGYSTVLPIRDSAAPSISAGWAMVASATDGPPTHSDSGEVLHWIVVSPSGEFQVGRNIADGAYAAQDFVRIRIGGEWVASLWPASLRDSGRPPAICQQIQERDVERRGLELAENVMSTIALNMQINDLCERRYAVPSGIVTPRAMPAELGGDDDLRTLWIDHDAQRIRY